MIGASSTTWMLLACVHKMADLHAGCTGASFEALTVLFVLHNH